MALQPKIILAPKDIEPSFPDWEVKGVLNPGAIRTKSGEIILYARVAESPSQSNARAIKCPVIISKEDYNAAYEDVDKRLIVKKDGNILFLKENICRLTTLSHLRKVIIDESGFKVREIDKLTSFHGIPLESEYGVEDPRITKIGEKYFMTYVGVSERNGVSTYLTESKDLNNWTRKGIIFQEQNKDVALFPEKINGLFVALNRPENAFAFSRPNIWISYSKDLIFWGKENSLLNTRLNSWESERNGSGAPPIKTSKGWLLIYHGVSKNKNVYSYNAGVALLDLKNPQKILARSRPDKPLFKPSNAHEKNGFVNNVVFPTAAILTKDKTDLLIYAGASDKFIEVRKISLKEIFNSLEFTNA